MLCRLVCFFGLLFHLLFELVEHLLCILELGVLLRQSSFSIFKLLLVLLLQTLLDLGQLVDFCDDLFHLDVFE